MSRIIKLTQKSQNKYRITTATNKTRTTWAIINKQKSFVPKQDIFKINIDNHIVTDPLLITNSFNNYFIDLVETQKSDTLYKNLLSTNLNSLYMLPTNPHDIYTKINSLNNTKSTGYDDISTIILKKSSPYISTILSHILNMCIAEGIYPEKLKKSLIKPIFKKGDKENMTCYRPIALIPVISKVFERVIYNSINNYFEKNNLFAPEQTGFRKNKSIELALYNFLQKTTDCVNRDILVSALYMDLTKAFDFVDHKILLSKLETYGIRGNILKLLKSYLSDRSQATVISQICPIEKQMIHYKSEFRNINFGVPQGSILGPLLFNIYINDLPRVLQQKMILFADDSTVIFTGNNTSILTKNINYTLENIINWLKCNNLLINLDKTTLMTFSNRRKHPPFDIHYNDKTISNTDSTKFLGITIDCNLNWKEHATNITSKLNRFSYALYLLTKVADVKTVVTSYHAYVASTLRYGIIFWGNCSYGEDVFRAQKKCIRSICRLKTTDSCKPYFKYLKIHTMTGIYILECVLFVKRNSEFFDKFNTRRLNKKLKMPTSKCTLFSKSFFCMGPKLYNHLPKTLRDIDNLQSFKTNLKQFLINKAYYTVNDYLLDKF